MHVLVTGGAGYIGSQTAIVLRRSGLDPTLLDNLSTGHRWAAGPCTLVVADLADRQSIIDTIKKHKIEAVMHFAGSAYVGESIGNPKRYFENNIVNSLNLLGAMRDTGVKHIVYSSTCATYGIPIDIPISEEQPQCPISPYGESKLCVERALKWYGEAYGLRWMTLRYFNAAGADPDGELGEDHDPETHLVPLSIQAALRERPFIEVFGRDYPTPDGTAIRDYVHVTDLAEAHLLALNYLLDRGTSTALNLGSGFGHSVHQIISSVEHFTGQRIPVRNAPRRFGDPGVLVADASKAARVLGWKPQYSDLATIVETAVRWHASRSLAK